MSHLVVLKANLTVFYFAFKSNIAQGDKKGANTPLHKALFGLLSVMTRPLWLK